MVLCDLNVDELADINDGLENLGRASKGYFVDLASQQSIRMMVEEVRRDFGRVDILINCAAINKREPLLEVEESTFDKIMSVNLRGLFQLTQAIVPLMPEEGGKIINIGSLTSEVARATVAPYTAAKGGIKQLTRSMAAEWAAHGIQANAIGPGYIITDMNKALVEDAKFDAWVRGRTPSGRWGVPDDLIGVTVFLASAASAYVNGQIIYVDGGILASL